MYGISQQSFIISHKNTRIIVNKKKNRDNHIHNHSIIVYVIYISYFPIFVVSLHGVVVRALSSHARGRGFDPRCRRNIFFFNSYFTRKIN